MSTAPLSTFKTGDLYTALQNALDTKDYKVEGGRYVHLKSGDKETTTSIRKIREHIETLSKGANDEDKKILQKCLRLNGRIDVELDKGVKGVGAKIKLAFHHIGKPFAKSQRALQAAAFKKLSPQASGIKDEAIRLKKGASNEEVVRGFAKALSKDNELNEDVFAAFAELAVKYPKQALALIQHKEMKIVPKNIMEELAVFVPAAREEIKNMEAARIPVKSGSESEIEQEVEPRVEPSVEEIESEEIEPEIKPEIRPARKPPVKTEVEPQVEEVEDVEPEVITEKPVKEEPVVEVKPEDKKGFFAPVVDFFGGYFAPTNLDNLKKEIEAEGRKAINGNLSFLLPANVINNEKELAKIADQIKPNIQLFKEKLNIKDNNLVTMGELIDFLRNPTPLGKTFMETLLLSKDEFAKYEFVLDGKALVKIIPPVKLSKDEAKLAALLSDKVEGNSATFERAFHSFFDKHHGDLKHGVDADVRKLLSKGALKDKLPLTLSSKESENVEFLKTVFGVAEHGITPDKWIVTQNSKNVVTLPAELKGPQQIISLVNKYMIGDTDKFIALLKAGDADQVVKNLGKLHGPLSTWTTERKVDLKAMTKPQREDFAKALTKSDFTANLLVVTEKTKNTVIVEIKAVQKAEADLVKDSKAAIRSIINKHFTQSDDLDALVTTLLKGATTSEQLKNREVNLEKNFKLLTTALQGRKIDGDELVKNEILSRQVLSGLMSNDYKGGDIKFKLINSKAGAAVIDTIKLRGIDFDDVYKNYFASRFGAKPTQKAAFKAVYDEFVLAHKSEITEESVDSAVDKMNGTWKKYPNKPAFAPSTEIVNQQFLAALFETKDQLLDAHDHPAKFNDWFTVKDGAHTIERPKSLSSASEIKTEKEAIKKAYLTCMTEDAGVFRALTSGVTKLEDLKARKAIVVANFGKLAGYYGMKNWGVGAVIKFNSNLLMKGDEDARDEFLKALTMKSFDPSNITFGDNKTIGNVEYRTLKGYKLSAADQVHKAKSAQQIEQALKDGYITELNQLCESYFFFDARGIIDPTTGLPGRIDEPFAFENMLQLAGYPNADQLNANTLGEIATRVKANMGRLHGLPNGTDKQNPFNPAPKRINGESIPPNQLLKLLTDPRPLASGNAVRLDNAVIFGNQRIAVINPASVSARYNQALRYIPGDDANNIR